MRKPTSTAAAAYLRSSKDRADISLSAQLHELEKLATAKGLSIVRTYEDAVQSGSTEDRPAWAELATDLRNGSRGWSNLLVYDTSRIARGRHIAQAFRYECRRRGVELLIARMPETDPISAVILESVMEAMDEVHSLMSREKGLAGMRENVRRGFRAGGKAPWGYELVHQSTGAVRDGRAVMKSTLQLGPEAELARRYFHARLAGMPRNQAVRELGITLNKSSLFGIEQNALVYAGHTVWNQHETKRARGTGNRKRRPREEWVIQRDTHPALITEAQAESILVQLATSDVSRAISLAKAASGNYLLSGILVTSDGQPWVGAGTHYRLKPADGRRGKFVSRDVLERAVTDRLRSDFASDTFVKHITDQVRASNAPGSSAASIQSEIAALKRKQDRAARLAVESGAEAYSRLVQVLAEQIVALQREAAAVAAEDMAGSALRQISLDQVRAIVGSRLDDADPDPNAIRAFVARVVLDPPYTEASVEYCLPMASPRRADRSAAIGPVSVVRLAA